ncbi:DNA polymerase zeta catalytic subunit isoform X2 [Euwallacea fornicatus]|uniref:DNA polymerase zeta catalytic subunit isoform X2 n=1 Tax=Euwallacea fornicatus TaxID=995702 RepID=UPI00338F370A
MPYSVKIVVLDYYMSAPTPGLDVIYSEFRSSTISQVPVIRCFGSLETGKKICVHIHGIFPYLYIPYDGKTNPEELMYKLAAAIDKTINIQFNQASSNTQHVYKISLVSGIPMYGYHAKKHQFLKIYLYNPSLVLKVGALLLNKHILAQVFQPHEVHLNFTLQFMIDYNLHGMSSMVMSDLKFRFNPEKPETGINKDLFLPHSIKKNSLCELEGDILAENILNKQEILSGNLAVNPGITTLWEDEKQRRRNKNQTSQLGCFLELKNINVAPTKTHLVYQQALKERLAILSTDNVIENESNPNVSIYPAETPSDLNIQSASLLDVHGSSSLELSLDETIISNNQNLDTTLTPNDVSLDQDAQSFLRILEQLAGEKIVEVEEEGCVLSQLPPLEHNEEIAEDDLDLSMPLESLTTPVKPYMNLDQYSHNSDENEDCFNTTLIPQIDGQYYSSDSDDENLTEENLDESMIAKATAPQQCNTKSTSLFYMAKELVSCPKKSPDKLSLSPYVLLPRCKLIVKLRRLDIEKYHSVNTNKLHLYHKPPPPSKMQETSAKIIRLLKFRVNQLTLKRKLLSIGKVIKRNSVAQLAHGLKPKFRVMSRNTQFLMPENESTLKSLIRLTHNYIDPDLHLFINTPLTAYFLYYGGQSVPVTIQIPQNLPHSEVKFLCDTFKVSGECDERSLRKSRRKLTLLQDIILNRKRGVKRTHSGSLKISEKNRNHTELKHLIVRLERSECAELNYAICPNTKGNITKQSLDTKLRLENQVVEESRKIEHLNLLKNCDVSGVSASQNILPIIQSGQSYFQSKQSLISKYENCFKFELLKKEIFKIEKIGRVKQRKALISNMCCVSAQEKRKFSLDIEKKRFSSPFLITPKLINSEQEKGNYSASSFPFGNGEDIFKSASKRNINKTLPIRNMYVNCDGAVDSSSEDEQDISLKTKSMKKRPRSSLYPPLPISVMNTPSTAKCDSGPADNKLPISGYHKDCPSANQSVKVSYKRNLFSSQKTSSLNHTIVQEFISCTYSSESAHTTSPIPKQSCTPVQQTQTCRDVSQSCDPSHGESDLFSENENANEDNLTVSEKYDLNSKFHAKEGCSTIFTPDSSAPNSGHSLSSDIPPYQLHLTSIKNQPGKPQAPTRSRVEATLREYKIPKIQQQEPFYGNADDYTGFVEIGQRTLRIPSKTAVHLPDFESQYNAIEGFRKKFIESVAKLKWNANNVKSMKLAHCANKNVVLRPVKSAPSVRSVRNWVKNMSHYEESSPEPTPHEGRSKVFYIPNSPDNMNGDSDCELHLTPLTPLSPIIDQRKKRKKTINPAKNGSGNKSCQISGQTQNNTFGFEKSVQDLHAARVVEQHQYLTIMVMELHVRTRDDLKPDPQLDQIGAVFYSILNDIPEINKKKHKIRGVIAINNLPMELEKIRADFLYGLEIDCDITYVKTEEALINSVVELVRMWDADILTGYEIEMLSWGYLIERALVLSINLMSLLGRSELHKFGRSKLSHQEFETNIIGRIVLNVWRIMRHEIAVQSYTFESVVYHILHRRIPLYPFKDLTFWWDHHSNLYRHRTVRYYLLRVDIILELFHKLDFINRTSELARLFGIMFYEVLSRGSQFRVESMMLRLAKPLNFVPVSPDVKQRAHMKAPEFIPLVMEPESKMYTDPVIVLDFQSLYPSLIIAYNYCFTTCVGRVSNLGQNHPFEFGATQLNVPKKLIEKLSKRNLLNFSPCGVAFVKQKVREGILPRMLKEVLDTRLMVKNSMKENKGEDNLQKVLHNRQLGLKLIANVTYGYTAANFSGRMCCVEIGDSIVSKGRETLQRAIAVVEGSTEWEARVVYGDTDSLFVLVPGRTKEEAFEIGKQIADAVTADNPDPVKLKLEKVYQPCILQTKKRYVGYMYEGPDDTVPVYEAKGIETVRRDGCPAVSKMLQKCLKLLFETKDAGRASIQDLTFAKEYRGSSGYRPGACVPALELARKWTLTDKRNEPRSGERVPYIIVNGPPGLPLIRLVRTPKDLLSDSALRPNALYYITKVIIPPLNRCLNLIGADVNIWFNQMPRKSTRYLPNSSPNIKTTISQYFVSKMCACCSDPTMEGICVKCRQKPHLAALVLMEKLRKWEENYNNTLLMCNSCTGYLNQVNCESLDCPVLYRRTQTCNDLQQSAYVRELLETGTIFSKSSFFDSG